VSGLELAKAPHQFGVIGVSESIQRRQK